MKSNIYSNIENAIKSKTENFSEYKFYILDWSDKEYNELPFINDQIFKDFLAVVDDNYDDDDEHKKLYKKYKFLYKSLDNGDDAPFIFNICSFETLEDIWFSTNLNLCMQITLLHIYLRYTKSFQEIEFMIYGKNNDKLDIIKGRITSESIYWDK